MTTQITQFIYGWQTLIAGLLAILAGVITVRGTRSAAQMQINAMRETTERQIAAARDESDKAARREKEAEETSRFRAGKIALSMFDSLAETVKSRLSQFSHNNPEGELSGTALDEIRDIPIPEAEKLRAYVALLDPSIIPQFDQLFRELRAFGAARGGTHVGPLKHMLDGFLEHIGMLQAQIKSSLDSRSRWSGPTQRSW